MFDERGESGDGIVGVNEAWGEELGTRGRANIVDPVVKTIEVEQRVFERMVMR